MIMCVAQLSDDVRSVFRFFAFYLANGTLVIELLEDIDYRSVVVAYGSGLEQVLAIFANVLDFDEAGQVTNYADADYRADQWIKGMRWHLRGGSLVR